MQTHADAILNGVAVDLTNYVIKNGSEIIVLFGQISEPSAQRSALLDGYDIEPRHYSFAFGFV